MFIQISEEESQATHQVTDKLTVNKESQQPVFQQTH